MSAQSIAMSAHRPLAFAWVSPLYRSSLLRSLSSAFGTQFYLSAGWKFVYDLTQFILPFFVNYVVR